MSDNSGAGGNPQGGIPPVPPPGPQQPGQPYPGQHAQPAPGPQQGQPYPGQPQPYPGQQGQPYPGQPGQPYPGQPQQPFPAGPPAPPQGPNPTAPTQSFGQPQPYGQQPYPGGPGGPGFGGPGAGGPGGGQPFNRKLLFIIIGAVVAIALIVTAVIVIVNLTTSKPNSDDKPSAKPSASATAEEKPKGDPQVVPVQAFFDAIADGNAKKATEQFDTRPTGALISDEVIERSNELGSIEDLELELESDDTYSATVVATYTINGESFSEDFQVHNGYSTSSTKFKISSGGAYRFSDYTDSFYLNGKKPGSSGGYAFLGLYELTGPNDNYTVTGTSQFVIDATLSSPPSDAKLEVSEAGKATFSELVNAAVNACVAETTFTAGCNLTVQSSFSNGTLKDGTVVRSIPASLQSNLADLQPSLSYSGTVVESRYLGSIDVSADCVLDGADTQCELYTPPSLGYAQVDLAAESPTVSWD